MTTARIKKMQSLLGEFEIDCLLITAPTDILYFTGQSVSVGKLLFTENTAHLIVDGRYFESCEKNAPCTVLLSDEHTFKHLLTKSKATTLGFSSQDTSYSDYVSLQILIQSLSCTLVPLDSPTSRLRMIKDDNEIEALKQAAALGNQGYQHIKDMIIEGITEEELAIELEIYWKKKGSQKTAFDPIIAFGKNSAMPHYRAAKEKLKNGDTVLIDIGVTLNHYHSDMTRTHFLGEPHPQMKEIYEIVQTAQQLALDNCLPGITVGELDAVARDYIASKGYGPQFTHSLGHGIGLEIHEFPILRNKPPYQSVILQPGMAITIEPGIYLPGIGGVRIEDTVILTENGHLNVTREG